MAGYNGPIDMNRGVMYCTVPGYPNFRIFMYLDTPGEYFTENLQAIPADLAAKAGFPVERFRKQALLNSEKAKFEQVMRSQLQMGDTQEVYAEHEGLQVIHYPESGDAILLRDGQRLYPTPVKLALAMVLYEEFVKDAKGRAEEVKAAPPEDAKSSAADPSPPPAPKAKAGALLK